MNRRQQRELKSLEKVIDEPRDRLFEFVEELYRSNHIDTKTYAEATTALYAMKDVFHTLRRAS